jgi:hypothetical protein
VMQLAPHARCTPSPRTRSAPSPRLRGEGGGEGDSPRTRSLESPPHPLAALATSPRKRGEVGARGTVSAPFASHGIPGPFVPAKAGTQFLNDTLDSRLRGNERGSGNFVDDITC